MLTSSCNADSWRADFDMDLTSNLPCQTKATLWLDKRPLTGLLAIRIDHDIVCVHTILYIIFLDLSYRMGMAFTYMTLD